MGLLDWIKMKCGCLKDPEPTKNSIKIRAAAANPPPAINPPIRNIPNATQSQPPAPNPLALALGSAAEAQYRKGEHYVSNNGPFSRNPSVKNSSDVDEEGKPNNPIAQTNPTPQTNQNPIPKSTTTQYAGMAAALAIAKGQSIHSDSLQPPLRPLAPPLQTIDSSRSTAGTTVTSTPTAASSIPSPLSAASSSSQTPSILPVAATVVTYKERSGSRGSISMTNAAGLHLALPTTTTVIKSKLSARSRRLGPEYKNSGAGVTVDAAVPLFTDLETTSASDAAATRPYTHNELPPTPPRLAQNSRP